MGPCECGAEVKYDDGSCSNSASEHWKAIATEQRARADAAESEVVRAATAVARFISREPPPADACQTCGFKHATAPHIADRHLCTFSNNGHDMRTACEVDLDSWTAPPNWTFSAQLVTCPKCMLWIQATLFDKVDAALAEVALWKKATGRDDAEALDLELGRAGIDTHLRVLNEMRLKAERERDKMRTALGGLIQALRVGPNALLGPALIDAEAAIAPAPKSCALCKTAGSCTGACGE